MKPLKTSVDITLGETVKLLRNRNRLSQAELAKLAGVSRNCISLLENDKSNVTFGTIVSIFAAFNIDVEIKLQPDDSSNGIDE